MTRRPTPPDDLETDVLDRLIDIKIPSGVPVFETKQKAMMFAAALGLWRGERTPLEKKGVGIRFDVFQNDNDDGFIDALAVVDKRTLNVLSEDRADERITIFEEYAHTGLREMKHVCFEQEGNPLDNLLRLAEEPRQADPNGIPGIDPGVLRGLMGS